MEPIRTERLILRGFRESDYEDLFEILRQLEHDEFEGYPGITFENARAHLAERVGSEEYYAMELAGTGKVIGNLYCGSREFSAKELGYIVHAEHRRKGYALEALSAVADAMFRADVHRLYAECDPRNVPSWRLLEKAGFRREAHFRENVFFFRDAEGNPVWKDTFVYALLNDRQI